MRSGSLLMRKSIDITVGGNFADYSSIIMHERSSKPVGQPFMPNAGSLMGPGVWLVGKDSDGSLIHTYAARSVNSTGQTLAEFLSVNFKSFAPSSPTIDLARATYRPSHGAQTLRGTGVYLGEFWLHQHFRRGLDKTLVEQLNGLLCKEILERLDCDYAFSFIRQELVESGFAARLGFLHVEPDVFSVFEQGASSPITGYLAYNTNHDLQHVVRMAEQPSK